ncbi:MAG: hypothetical protein R3E09_03035 [Novosphingobium sp.]|nr:hypothetical protein [Novosphingobium sp.]
MTGQLEARIAAGLGVSVASQVRGFAARLGEESRALVVLFYGSNLRTGSLDGVIDYYVLVPGEAERGVWPRVSYREWTDAGMPLRAKVATVTLEKFREAASGALIDTTIWARFVQPSALVWQRDEAAGHAVAESLAAACQTAARLAAIVGPDQGREEDYWSALFRATYSAEFRIESSGREQSILTLNAQHFEGLFPLALEAAGIEFERIDDLFAPRIAAAERARIERWWRKRRMLGKPLNVLRLLRAASTFDGAARYAAWKVERHTGVKIALTPWRERHPILSAPAVLFSLWRAQRKGRANQR